MQKLAVEFLGTFAIVYVILATGNAYVIAATLAVAIILGGAISGGVYNPAAAVGLWMANKIGKADLVPYILAQVLGGVAAYQVIRKFGALKLKL